MFWLPGKRIGTHVLQKHFFILSIVQIRFYSPGVSAIIIKTE